MTTELTFTNPTSDITTARLALARLERRLNDVVDPCDPSTETTDLVFAVMALEDVYPPYPPLPDQPDPGPDPRADLDLALTALRAAIENADTARETLRLAMVVRDLRPLIESPHLHAARPNEHAPNEHAPNEHGR